MKDFLFLKKQAMHVRQRIISAADYCNEKVHWGSSLSCVEILLSLMSDVSNLTKKNVENNDRDIIIVSKGHAALAYYAVMEECGLLEGNFIADYQKNGSKYPEELVKDESLNIECSTGSLGIGLPYAVGVAIQGKRKGDMKRIFCLVGDGECDEGSIWEAIMLASQLKLDNLTLIIDLNGLQADGETKKIIDWSGIEAIFNAFGWKTRKVNGHNFEELRLALIEKSKVPSVVIAETIKGKGISFMENDFAWHDQVLNKHLLQKAKEEVGLSSVTI